MRGNALISWGAPPFAVFEGGPIPKARGGGGSAPKLWNPTLAAKNAARMGRPSVGKGKEKT
jgi:hypothetical protein